MYVPCQGQLQTLRSVDTGNYTYYGQTQLKVKDKLQASTGGIKHINREEVNK
jgi:hypothetical protein